jgi:hypothetical protein
MTEQAQVILPAQEYIDILTQVLEMNQAIVRQNSLIVQAISLPQLIIKGDQL